MGTYLPSSIYPSHLPHPPLQRKCERYWATKLNEPFKPGRNLSVTILRCDTHPEFELRTIKVEKVGTIVLTIGPSLHIHSSNNPSEPNSAPSNATKKLE